MIRVIISGDQKFDDEALLFQVCDRMLSRRLEAEEEIEVVCRDLSGRYGIEGVRAAGADTLAQRYAEERGLTANIFHLDRGSYGKAAVGITNGAMALYASHAIVFSDGYEADTGDLLNQCHRYGLQTRQIRYQSQVEQLALSVNRK